MAGVWVLPRAGTGAPRTVGGGRDLPRSREGRELAPAAHSEAPGVLTPPTPLPALLFPAHQQVPPGCPGQGGPMASSWGPVSVDLEVQGAGLDPHSLETMQYRIYWRAILCSSPSSPSSSSPPPFLPAPLISPHLLFLLEPGELDLVEGKRWIYNFKLTYIVFLLPLFRRLPLLTPSYQNPLPTLWRSGDQEQGLGR